MKCRQVSRTETAGDKKRSTEARIRSVNVQCRRIHHDLRRFSSGSWLHCMWRMWLFHVFFENCELVDIKAIVFFLLLSVCQIVFQCENCIASIPLYPLFYFFKFILFRCKFLYCLLLAVSQLTFNTLLVFRPLPLSIFFDQSINQ